MKRLLPGRGVSSALAWPASARRRRAAIREAIAEMHLADINTGAAWFDDLYDGCLDCDGPTEGYTLAVLETAVKPDPSTSTRPTETST